MCIHHYSIRWISRHCVTNAKLIFTAAKKVDVVLLIHEILINTHKQFWPGGGKVI